MSGVSLGIGICHWGVDELSAMASLRVILKFFRKFYIRHGEVGIVITYLVHGEVSKKKKKRKMFRGIYHSDFH
jgi:hypothetical protein